MNLWKSRMKDRQFETMAITAAEASAIIATKYPDLSDGFPAPEAIICTPPPPARLRRKRPHSPHSTKRMKLVDRFNQIADRSVTLLYPPLYSTDDYNQEDDAFIPYASPLKADRMSSFLRVRNLSTPKKSKRISRNLFDGSKRLRAQQTYYNTVGLKHKVNPDDLRRRQF